jgi:phosphatidylglycerol:prolipoprotein diacylglycerol transferase
MYPRISDLFRDLFGFSFPLPLYSFGLMVATAILTATWLARKELDRKYAAGEIGPVEMKEQDKKGRTKIVKESPSAIMWNVMLLAAVFGVIGSKLFHIIDFWDRFVLDPAGMLFSTGGLTIYGGIIVAGLAIWIYARRKGVHFGALADAIAPGLMLAYGIGRIGCYLAGDGDWGKCSDLADKPAFLPDWLWSETFPRNILNRDLAAECGAGFDGVYPTMLYEFAMAAVLAGILWALRKHHHQFGWLFSLYLVFNGIERFLIEQIRVNPELSWIGLTQAMLIALLFIAAGIGGMILLWKRRTPEPASAVS